MQTAEHPLQAITLALQPAPHPGIETILQLLKEETLLRHGGQRGTQAPHQPFDPLPGKTQARLDEGRKTRTEMIQMNFPLQSAAGDKFGSRARGRGAQISDIIGDGRVGFVADSGDHWNP